MATNTDPDRGANREASDESCSLRSLSSGEELAGTAPSGVLRWCAIETEGRWEADPLDCAALAPWRSQLQAYLTASGSRLQLVEAREPRPREPRFLAVQLPAEGAATQRTGPLSALWSEPTGSSVEPLRDSIYLVCVHGRRDRCCAGRGTPLANALRARVGDRCRTTSHLGGHRFAPTLVHWPSGLCLGRLSLDQLPSVVEALDSGRVPDDSLLRGRCALTPAQQAAEIFLWRAGLANRWDAWSPQMPTPVHSHAEHLGTSHADTVQVEVAERRSQQASPPPGTTQPVPRRFRLRLLHRECSETITPSCGKLANQPVRNWQLSSLEEISAPVGG